MLYQQVSQRNVEVPAEAEPLLLEATPAVETRPADTDGPATEPTGVHGLLQPSAQPASEGKQSDSPAPAAAVQRCSALL